MIQFPGAHSAHAPAGPQAELLNRLGDLLYGISSVVFVLVVAAGRQAVLTPPRSS